MTRFLPPVILQRQLTILYFSARFVMNNVLSSLPSRREYGKVLLLTWFALALGSIGAGAQSSTPNNVFGPGRFLGWGPNSGHLFFKTNDVARMILQNNTGFLGIGTGSPAALLSVGSSSQFQVSSTGDLVRINDVAYSFPTLQGHSGSYLKTLADGQLIWSGTNNLNNTFLGEGAFLSGTVGDYNTAIGYNTLKENTEGWSNTAVGADALKANTAGIQNTAIGAGTLLSNTTGNWNTATGDGALYSNTTGEHNTADGTSSLWFNTTGSHNSAYGAYSLRANTTGSSNTAGGISALTTNTTGSDNAAFGAWSLIANTTGSSNTACGSGTLYANTTGNDNTAVGKGALGNNTTGASNASLGIGSLFWNVTGNYNAAYGTSALRNNASGDLNSAFGFDALYNNTTGMNNTAVGAFALDNNTTGSNNTIVGVSADVSAGNLSNATAIGSVATVNASNKVRIGNTSVTTVEGQVDYTYPSDARFKERVQSDVLGLDFILKLRPVSYNFNRLAFARFIGEKTAGRESELQTLSQQRSTGFLAQEVEQVIAETGFTAFDAVHAPANDRDNYSVAYSHFVVPLVQAVQEQHKIIGELLAKLDELSAKVEVLQSGAVSRTGSTEGNSEAGNLSPLVFQLQPNPASDNIAIRYWLPQAQAVTLGIHDALGRSIATITAAGNKGENAVSYDTRTLPAGKYTLKLLTSSGSSAAPFVIIR
jgi:hypothetical protein